MSNLGKIFKTQIGGKEVVVELNNDNCSGDLSGKGILLTGDRVGQCVVTFKSKEEHKKENGIYEKTFTINVIDGNTKVSTTHESYLNSELYKQNVDVKYGGDVLAKGHNLALWAYELSFEHPTTKKTMKFKCMPPIAKAPWNVFEKEINLKEQI